MGQKCALITKNHEKMATIRVYGIKDKPVELTADKIAKVTKSNFLENLYNFRQPRAVIAASICEYYSLKKSPGFEGFVDRNCANPSWQPSSSASVFLKKIEQTANGYFTCVDDISTDDLFLTRIKNPKQCKGNSFKISMAGITGINTLNPMGHIRSHGLCNFSKFSKS